MRLEGFFFNFLTKLNYKMLIKMRFMFIFGNKQMIFFVWDK